MSVPAIAGIGGTIAGMTEVAVSCHFCGKRNVARTIRGLELSYPACQAEACQAAREMARRMDPPPPKNTFLTPTMLAQEAMRTMQNQLSALTLVNRPLGESFQGRRVGATVHLTKPKRPSRLKIGSWPWRRAKITVP